MVLGRVLVGLLLMSAPMPVRAAYVSSHGGATVTDSQGITWLTDANLPASMPLTVPLCAPGGPADCINASGSMNYPTAVQWVAALNKSDYLGHGNWQLPATQFLTAGCTATGPGGSSFGYNCTGSALGSLYAGLGLSAPTPVTTPVTSKFGAFTDLQPNLYWTGTQSASEPIAYHTFSFATGWRGTNIGANTSIPGEGPVANFFYVLPRLSGNVPIPGNTVYDPAANVTWLADGNIAASNSFGLPLCSGIGSVTSAPCVNADGSMTQTSAQQFIKNMNSAHYLGHNDWALPRSIEPVSCQYAACAAVPADDPLASLYYNLLGLSAGQSVADPNTGSNGLFRDIQPYLYWSCQASKELGTAALSPCSPNPQCSPTTTPSCPNDMEWSFNFVDGFQGTDEEANDLFVTAYYVTSEPPALVILATAMLLVAYTTRRNFRPAAGSRGRPSVTVDEPHISPL